MLNSAAEVQELFGLPEETTGRLTMYLAEGARTLKTWVGTTVYAEAASNPLTGDADRNDAFKFAEAHLAMAAALPNLATAFNGRGAIKAEKAEADAQLSYYTAQEIAQRVTELTEAAKRATRRFWVTPDADRLLEALSPVLAIEVAEADVQFTIGQHTF